MTALALAPLAPYIIQGLVALPSIIMALKSVFTSSTATTDQKAGAVTAVAGTVIDIVGAASTGGQKKEMEKAKQALPAFEALLKSLMSVAELTGKPGEEKQKFVSDFAGQILDAWEVMSTGHQLNTVDTYKVSIQTVIDSYVPMLFPHEAGTINIENQQPSG